MTVWKSGRQREAVKRFSVAGLAEAGVEKTGGVIAFVFDDGYRSNYVNALPIFAKYGYAATIAVEVDKIGQDYNGDPNYPVCTAEDLRELIRSGWEVCNHPALNTSETEANMVSAARAENQLLIDLLTADKVKNYGTGVVSAGPGTYADEFGGYRVTSAVYRGGARNDTSDRAYRFLFDKVRSINGSVAERGDHLYVFGSSAERTMQMSAYPADTTMNQLSKTLAFVSSVAQTRSKAIMYVHDTSDTVVGLIPNILTSELDALLKRCYELGIAVVPLSRFSTGNAIWDSTFENVSGSLSDAGADYTAQFSAADTLNGATRCVELAATVGAANDNNAKYETESFVCEPFSRYRVRVRYKIDADLTLVGGTANRNHGLNLSLVTLQGNTSGLAACSSSARREIVLNDQAAAARLPYQATSGYDEYSVELVTGFGALALVRVSLFNATGAVRIGQIIAERLDSIIDRPLSGTHNFDTTIGRTIYLPTPNTSNGRQWEWELSVSYNPPEPTATYTYAYNDSASIASPSEGQTCYVLGAGAGAFAGQGGKLATYTSGAWAFSSIPINTFFKVTTAEGLTGRWFRHRGVKSDGSPLYETFWSAITNDRAIVTRTNSSIFKVWETSGARSDSFTWIARPRAVPGY